MTTQSRVSGSDVTGGVPTSAGRSRRDQLTRYNMHRSMSSMRAMKHPRHQNGWKDGREFIIYRVICLLATSPASQPTDNVTVKAKFHYTGPTGPARTRAEFFARPGPQTRVSDKVRAGPRESPTKSRTLSGPVRSGPCSGIWLLLCS